MWAVQALSYDSSSVKTEVYNNGKTHRLVKLLFFIYECAVILLTSVYSQVGARLMWEGGVVVIAYNA